MPLAHIHRCVFSAIATFTLGSFITETAWAAPIAPSHYYNFDAGTGTSVADTGSTGGKTGTFSAGNWSSTTPFAYSGNHSAQISSLQAQLTAPGFSVATQSTISLWGNYTSSNTGYLIDSAGANRILIYETGPDHVYFNGQNLANASAGVTFPAGTNWLNFVLVRNGTTVDTYENGVLKGTDTISISTAFTPTTWYFGSHSTGTSENWIGQIDEFAFWDTNLSGTDVATLYSQGTSAFVPEPASLGLLGLGAVGLLARRRRI